MPRQLLGTAIAANTITTTQLTTTVVNQISAGGGPRVSSLIYPGNDTAGNTVGGQTVYINGSGFETNNAIYINGNAVPSKSFISASNLSFTTPALAAGIYPVYVINTDNGATAIFIPGYISSAEPAWVTSAGSLSASQDELSAWSYSLSATGDAPITYALAAGSSLPGGISLAANGLISGTISSPTGNVTTYTFSVVATDAQNQDSTRQFTVTTSTGEGVLFANNVLLIHADGTNNGNNHAFIDSSNNNFTITRNGNATQGSFSPFSQTGWSGYFDGTTDSVSFNSIELTSDFTIEAWIYPERAGNGGGGQALIFAQSSPNQQFTHNADGTIGYYNGSVFTNTTTTVSLERWTHVAWVRSGSSTRIYINGANSAINSSDSGSRYIQRIGEFVSPTGYAFKGFISNARVTANAMYSGSSFSLPTSPLSVTANTKLLTLNSNRFVDSNTTPLTITRDNDTKIISFSPFAPSTAYSTSAVGGSGYFDGTGDYLSTSSAITLSSNFTIECWFNLSSAQSDYKMLCGESISGGLYFTIRSSGVEAQFGASSSTAASCSHTFTVGAWHHIALVRNSGTVSIYIDGVSKTVTNNSQAGSFVVQYVGVGYSTSYVFHGSISNFRIVSSAVYTSAFTPPTSPLTNIANTQLLLNFTNAQIFDQTAKNVLETVGDAKVSTAQYKYGTGSMYFDGSGDYLAKPTDPLYLFGTGDFTAECWVYPTALNTYNMIFGYSSPNQYWAIRNTGHIHFYDGTSAFEASTNAISTNTWTHIAISRQGTTLRQFVNGVQAISSTCGTTIGSASGANIWFGASAAYVSQHFFTGYIDDLRITKGYARYTSNFTPPTSALKDK